MTMASIKRIAGDCRTTHRWAKIKNDFYFSWRDRYTTYRIVGCGRKYVRLMNARGGVFTVTPDLIDSAW